MKWFYIYDRTTKKSLGACKARLPELAIDQLMQTKASYDVYRPNLAVIPLLRAVEQMTTRLEITLVDEWIYLSRAGEAYVETGVRLAKQGKPEEAAIYKAMEIRWAELEPKR